MGGRSALREKREGKSPAQVPYGAAGSQLEKENGGNAPAEVPVPGFVVKHPHTGQGPDAAAQQGQQKQRLFRPAPPAPPQPRKKLPWWRRLWIWLKNN